MVVKDYIEVFGGYPQGPAQTGLGNGLINSFSNPVPILLYLYFSFVALSVFVYVIYKRFVSLDESGRDDGAAVLRTQVQQRSANNSMGGRRRSFSSLEQQRTVFADGDTKMIGYRDTPLGKFCYYLVFSIPVVMSIWYFVLIFDTYWTCEVTGPDNLCFFGSRPIFGTGLVDSEIFFVWWCMSLVGNIFLFFKGKYIPNFFRTRCIFANAEFVYCAKKHKKVVMSRCNWLITKAREFSSRMGYDAAYFESTVPVDVNGSVRSLEFMCMQFVYERSSGVFQPSNYSAPSIYNELRAAKGMTSEEHRMILQLLGPNIIPYRVSTWVSLIKKEFCSYLYLYQFTFYSVWLWFSAIIWGCPQMIVVLGCGLLSIIIMRKNQQSIAEITKIKATCTVQRDGSWVTVDSTELVPGDKLKLTERNWVLPCDLIVVQGTCITDESGLTGESMPVRKSELPSTAALQDTKYEEDRDSKHTLYAGTTLLQAGSGEADEVLAVVSETGIRTVKGDMISHILFPSSMIFEYDEELTVVFGMLSCYALVLFVISVYLQTTISPLTWVGTFAFAAFTISQVLPPLLPVALVVGHTMSAKRLKDQGVLCVNPKRIAISGKIRAFLFDKTGTLTKQGLDFLGVHQRQSQSGAPAFTQEIAEINSKAAGDDILTWGLATCHAVTGLRSEGTSSDPAGKGVELVGNQVEVQMFRGCGWELQERQGKHARVISPGGQETLTIENRFEFDHHTMTMSVVVRDAGGNVHVFVKGAPEKVAALCAGGSLPRDHDAVSRRHATNGCYVLALAHRSLGQVARMEEAKVSQLLRQHVEVAGQLDFLGLLLFRNELKPDTAQAIEKMLEGDVRPVMVTGDNAQCGFYIAKQCGMLRPESTVLLTELISHPGPGVKKVVWKRMGTDVDEGEKAMSTETVLKRVRQNQASGGKLELAITGKSLSILMRDITLMRELLLHTRIFARMKPDQKVAVVEMHIELGMITGMCGDGGNDCGALRAAHAGIALSDAEASVVSPFTSQSKSVQSVVDLLCEGRCALATSFAAYRFYITYGLLWSIVKTINFVYGVRMPITGYLTVDSVSSVWVAWAITVAKPLSQLLPYRPTSSLFSPQIMLSVLVPWAMWMLLMGGALVFQQNKPDHVTFPSALTKGVGYWELGDSWESTVFVVFMVFPLTWSGMVFSLGSKFRAMIFYNPAIWVVWGSIFILYTCLLLTDANQTTALFHVASNAFNGYNTRSAVWMRHQFPQGCTIEATTGPGRWIPDNCAEINETAVKCGPACMTLAPGQPSPAMDKSLRVTLWVMAICGMAAVLCWELFLTSVFVKPDPPLVELLADMVDTEDRSGIEETPVDNPLNLNGEKVRSLTVSEL